MYSRFALQSLLVGCVALVAGSNAHAQSGTRGGYSSPATTYNAPIASTPSYNAPSYSAPSYSAPSQSPSYSSVPQYGGAVQYPQSQSLIQNNGYTPYYGLNSVNYGMANPYTASSPCSGNAVARQPFSNYRQSYSYPTVRRFMGYRQ